MTVTAQELARLAPSGLAALASRGYARPRHVALLEGKLLALAAGRSRRLRVAWPPRHGKTELLKFFVAWWLLTNPTKRAIIACATASLAEHFSRRVRDLILEFGPLFGTRLRSDSRAVDRWELVQGGGLIAVGAGSSLVGRGADLLVADDVISGNEVATSKAQLAKLVDWFRRDVFTRLEPGGACVAVGTRWHQADLHGTLEEEERQGGEHWDTVVLPALCEDPETDPLGRERGEALWPERYPIAELERIRSTIGAGAWAGLYAQRPSPEDGERFKLEWLSTRFSWMGSDHIQIGSEAPVHKRDLRILAAVDVAVSTKASADYTAIAIGGQLPDGRLLLLDLLRDRLDAPSLVRALREFARDRWGAGEIWVERDGVGLPLIQLAREQNLPIRDTGSRGRDKGQRAAPLAIALEGGRFVLPQRAEWLEVLVEELLLFPNGRHEDTVDACAHLQNAAAEPRGFVGIIDVA